MGQLVSGASSAVNLAPPAMTIAGTGTNDVAKIWRNRLVIVHLEALLHPDLEGVPLGPLPMQGGPSTTVLNTAIIAFGSIVSRVCPLRTLPWLIDVGQRACRANERRISPAMPPCGMAR